MAHLNRRAKALTAVLATAALFITACGSSDDTSDAAGGADGATGGAGTGTIISGVAYATTNYHPSSTSSALAMGTNWHVVEGLYEQDLSDYSVYKALAAEDEPTEISDTEYEISIREGAKFSDGSDVTSADVVSSFDRAMAEGNIYAAMVDFIDTVEAKDDTTVTLKLQYPFELLKERLSVVKIVPESASDDELTSMPIGSGPYKYESITDAQVVAVPNEHYNGEKEATNGKLVWDVLVDDTARTNAGQSGAADIIENVSADNASLLEGAGMTVEEKDGFNLPFLLFNTEKEPFNDERVRQAFHRAINKQQLVDNNMSGKAVEATSFLPESHPNYSEAETDLSYDPEAAQALLEEAGAEDISVTLLTTDHTWIEQLSPQIKNDLEAVGITVNIQSQASASLYSDYLDVEDPSFDVALAPGDPSVFGQDPALLMNWWYGDNVWTQQRSFWQESDKEAFDELQNVITEGVKKPSAEAQENWDTAQNIIAENAVIYPLFHRTLLTAYNPEKIEGFKAISTTGLQLLDATSNE